MTDEEEMEEVEEEEEEEEERECERPRPLLLLPLLLLLSLSRTCSIELSITCLPFRVLLFGRAPAYSTTRCMPTNCSIASLNPRSFFSLFSSPSHLGVLFSPPFLPRPTERGVGVAADPQHVVGHNPRAY